MGAACISWLGFLRIAYRYCRYIEEREVRVGRVYRMSHFTSDKSTRFLASFEKSN